MMGNLAETFLRLLLTFLLSFAGMGKELREAGAHLPTVAQAETEEGAAFIAGEQPYLQLLHRSGEHLSGAAGQPATPGLKDLSRAGLQAASDFELRLQCITSQYLRYALRICRSQSGTVIIFPFHYFW